MKKLAVGGLAFLAAAVVAAATGFPPSNTSYVRDAMGRHIESGELAGAISVLYRDGVWEIECMGYANVEQKRKITLDDPFMQCSQTKGFCGVTVAMLVEEGKIDIDDPVHKYLPEFKTLWVEKSNTNGVRTLEQAKNTLTIRHVMTHTGGFSFELPAKRREIPGGGMSGGMPLRSAAAEAAELPLLFEPGTAVRYSNTGIDIGAAIVQTVSGMPWEKFLETRVLKPLEMHSTMFKPTDEMLARKIEMYECEQGRKAVWKAYKEPMQIPYNDDHIFPSAGAGLWTTARDQIKFYKMLMNLGVGDNGVRILREETVKNLLAADLRPEGVQERGYSLGLVAGGGGQFGHGGAWCTDARVDWKKKNLLIWVVQCWNWNMSWTPLRKNAAEAFFKADLGGAEMEAYTGRLK